MKVSRNVYAYVTPDAPGEFSIDVNADGDAYVTISGSMPTATLRLPRHQLTQMLYRLRDERSRTVTAEIAINNEPKQG